MRAREALLIAHPKIEYSQVKSLETYHKIWTTLESTFEGDKHAKRIRLQNWICLFQDAKMMEDESMRSFIRRIFEIFVQNNFCEGSKQDNEILWKILKTWTPPFNKVAKMINVLILYTKKFTREMFLGRLQVA